MLAVAGVCVVLGFVSHADALFGAAGIMFFFFVYAIAGTTIEVSPAAVTQRVWPLYRLSAPRDQITAIHWYGQSFTFTADDNRVLLKLASLGWKRSQLLDLSEALGARLYNHRTRCGLGRDRTVGHRLRRDSVGHDTSSPSGHVPG
jgi:hypothetical protein